jgi:hypothetical protein
VIHITDNRINPSDAAELPTTIRCNLSSTLQRAARSVGLSGGALELAYMSLRSAIAWWAGGRGGLVPPYGYDELIAFHAFGGDIGKSVSRLPMA